MRKILIDLYKIKDIYSGLGQFSKNFANALVSQNTNKFDIEFLVPGKTDIPLLVRNTKHFRPTILNRYFPSINKSYYIWHSLQQFPSFLPGKKTIWILTIHDLNFLIEKKGRKRDLYKKRLQKNINRADYITTISNFAKKEIEMNLELGEKEIRVIYNGISNGASIKPTRPPFVDDEKFFFSIGVFNQKKNFEVLLPLIKNFNKYKLIIAGKNNTAYGKFIEKEVNRLGLNDKIILPGKISESYKKWLYENCEAFLFPSLAEGFGMPIIEAMNAGKPVFSSSHTSLPEIGGSIAFYFSNFHIEQMSAFIKTKLKEVNNDPEGFKAASIDYAKRFNWQNCISQYIELYKEIIS